VKVKRAQIDNLRSLSFLILTFDTSERTSGAGLGELEDVIVEGDKDTELSDVKMLEGDCV